MQGDGAGRDGSDGADLHPLRSAARQQELSLLLGSMIAERSSREQIRAAVRPVCVQARREDVDAAEFVKVVKHCFAGSGPATSRDHAADLQQTLERIVSVCIDEYYACD